MLKIEIKTTPETERMLIEMPGDCSDALYKGVQQSVKEIQQYIKNSFGKAGNLKVLTGDLKNSIIGETEKRSKAIIGILSSNLNYAAIHEYGGTIRAKSKEYLTFKIGGSSWVKTKQSIIPARPYFRPGVVDNLDRVSKLITDIISKEMN